MMNKVKKIDSLAVKKFLLKKSVLIALILFAIVMECIYPEFLSFNNVANMLQDISMYGVAACGMTILIIGGDFDLSATSQYAWSMIFCITLIPQFGVLGAVILTLISAAIIGVINGLIITKLNINSFTTTLGTQLIVKGIALTYTGGNMVNTDNQFFTTLGYLKIFGISSLTYIYIIILIILSIFLYKTRFGRSIYACGGNPTVAKFAGINTDRVKIICFGIMGILCAIAGMMFVAQMRAGSVLYGTDLTMSCVAATVIGGTSLSGGSGNVVKTFMGVLLVNILYKALIFLGLSSYIQDMTKGLVVIAVVVLDYYTNELEKKSLKGKQ